MVFDFDDHHPGNNAMPWMCRLKALRPDFKVTLFSVPGLGSEEFWGSHPGWVELVPHGWLHPTPMECADWTREQLSAVLDHPFVQDHMAEGWKSPGWQISDACYEELLSRGYWVADQHLEDGRRPANLKTYFYEDGNWHGHVQDVCGNGIRETWQQLVLAVSEAVSFEWASEAAR